MAWHHLEKAYHDVHGMASYGIFLDLAARRASSLAVVLPERSGSGHELHQFVGGG